MKTAYLKVGSTVGLLFASAAALASDPKPAPPQEPAGFIAGGIIGGLAAGPVGAVIGAGVGTWLGNRVHRASEAKQAEAQVAALRADKHELETETAALTAADADLAETNRALTARLDQLSQSLDEAQAQAPTAEATPDQAARTGRGTAVETTPVDEARDETASVLDGLQGEVLFRTASAEIPAEAVQGIQVLADAVSKSPTLKVRIDGFADPRGTADSNLELSQARADAVRDLFLAAGVPDAALEVTAYGKSLSVAADTDGYALERRVRLTLKAEAGTVALQMPQ